jgi:hypothetical protein
MPRITRNKLNKIIQEELEEVRIEEGIFKDLSVIGRDIKKYFKNVRQQGAEEVGDEEQLQFQQNYINGLKAFRKNRAEAAKKHPESAKIQRQLAAADTALSVLRDDPTSKAAVETRDAIGAGVGLNVDVDTSAEAEMEAEIEKTYRRQGKKMPGRGEEAPGEEPAAAAVTSQALIKNPVEILDIVMKALLGKHLISTRLKGGISSLNKNQVKALARQIKIAGKEMKGGFSKEETEETEETLSEGLLHNIKISKAGLREALHLIQKHGV